MNTNDIPVPQGGTEVTLVSALTAGDVARMRDGMEKFRRLMSYYKCAIMEVETKFRVLDEQFSSRHERNPIDTIKTRLKSPESILEKLTRRGYEKTLASVERNLADVAGVRVICSFKDDVYMLADSLLKQDDVKLVTAKDYIKDPKPNGYRSLHLIVRVPVFFAGSKENVPVEVQIRTIAMDFWASLEHQIKYKKDIPDQEDVVAKLRECADVITQTDEKMLALRKRIEDAEDVPTEEEILFERISKLDTPLQ